MSKRKKLTPTEAAFAQMVADGESQSQAYRMTHDVDSWQDKSIHVAASRLANKPVVAERIDTLQGNAKRVRSSQGELMREWVLQRLEAEAIDTTNNPGATRVKALHLLGQAHGMWKDDKTITMKQDRPSHEVEEELAAKLRELMQAS